MIEEVTGKGVRIVRHGLKKHGITRSDCIHTSWFGLVLKFQVFFISYRESD